MGSGGRCALAVWGSPSSGKTVVSVKLAEYLAKKKKTCSLFFCRYDSTAASPVSVRRQTLRGSGRLAASLRQHM